MKKLNQKELPPVSIKSEIAQLKVKYLKEKQRTAELLFLDPDSYSLLMNALEKDLMDSFFNKDNYLINDQSTLHVNGISKFLGMDVYMIITRKRVVRVAI